VASPAGRFLQWKAVLRGAGTLGGVGVNYLPVNAALWSMTSWWFRGRASILTLNQSHPEACSSPSTLLSSSNSSSRLRRGFDPGVPSLLQHAQDRDARPTSIPWAAHTTTHDLYSRAVANLPRERETLSLVAGGLAQRLASPDSRAYLAIDACAGPRTRRVSADPGRRLRPPSHTPPTPSPAKRRTASRWTPPPSISALKRSRRADCKRSPALEQCRELDPRWLFATPRRILARRLLQYIDRRPCRTRAANTTTSASPWRFRQNQRAPGAVRLRPHTNVRGQYGIAANEKRNCGFKGTA